MRSSFPPGFLAFFFLILLLVLMPFLFVNIFFSALGKLGLTPVQSLFVVIGIFLGSTINIPVKRYQRDEAVETSRRTMYGLGRSFFIDLGRPQTVVLAVNVGGCIIPSCIAILQVYRLTQTGGNALLFCGIATLINIIVCQIFARPVENLGIVMPTFIPALAAVASALILTPNHAPAVAFVSGVMGPLVGADLLHLQDIKKMNTRVASIGGAGTFDGIVISAMLATLLA